MLAPARVLQVPAQFRQLRGEVVQLPTSAHFVEVVAEKHPVPPDRPLHVLSTLDCGVERGVEGSDVLALGFRGFLLAKELLGPCGC